MSFTPDSSVLCGLSLERAQLFGMPSVGSLYLKEDYRCYALKDDAPCTICGARATNSHHLVPRSVARRFPLKTPLGTFVLLSPLFALCGSGTTGCHGKFHEGMLSVRWEWDEPGIAEEWFNGELLAHGMKLQPEKLFELGRYVVSRYGFDLMEVRQ